VTLVEFLLARIAEDEAVARLASGDRWNRLADGNPKFSKVVAWGLTPIGAMNAEQDADHIARWDPARILAECEAKRRIVERAEDHRDSAYGEPEQFIPQPWHEILRLLALPYADHPDYLALDRVL
jgi:hypothetical protein